MTTATPAAEAIYSAIYVSSARSTDSDEVTEILRISRRNNLRDGITGLLAYKEGNFLQVLEGPQQAVKRLIANIGRDERHSGMIVLARRQLRGRLFPHWSMAYRDLTLESDEMAMRSGLLDGNELEKLAQAEPELCYKLLLSFKKSMRFE